MSLIIRGLWIRVGSIATCLLRNFFGVLYEVRIFRFLAVPRNWSLDWCVNIKKHRCLQIG